MIGEGGSRDLGLGVWYAGGSDGCVAVVECKRYFDVHERYLFLSFSSFRFFFLVVDI